MDDYKKWEADVNKVKAANKLLLEEFDQWLQDKGLVKKTIRNHIGNVDFFINNFLVYSDIVEAKDGIEEISSFLGDWFIRKASWSSKANIKSNASSFKKFYTFLFEKGRRDRSISKAINKELVISS